ncbi:MAG: VCBS repeat-containing protein, partial [Armatimonadetes bacterium]|nr:VCBS repeat-containing protein [Armatimonadota bacterium]
MPLRFRHEVIDSDPPGSEHDIVLLADLTGNGLPDVIIGSKRGDYNLMWYENPGWQR